MCKKYKYNSKVAARLAVYSAKINFCKDFRHYYHKQCESYHITSKPWNSYKRAMKARPTTSGTNPR